jgi:hypothetical protein
VQIYYAPPRTDHETMGVWDDFEEATRAFEQEIKRPRLKRLIEEGHVVAVKLEKRELSPWKSVRTL